MSANMAMQPKDAAEIHDMFFRASPSERTLILHNLAQTPLKAAPRIPTVRAKRAIQILEMAAYLQRRGEFHAGARRRPDPAHTRGRANRG